MPTSVRETEPHVTQIKPFIIVIPKLQVLMWDSYSISALLNVEPDDFQIRVYNKENRIFCRNQVSPVRDILFDSSHHNDQDISLQSRVQHIKT